MKLPPRSKPEEREFFLTRMLNDTGFLCRNVLGMDTDRDPTGEPVSEVGRGGVREDGPHGETIAFMDDEAAQYKVLWTPRFTYKSSKVTGYIIRNILKYKDISILLAMHTSEDAEDRVRVIRDILTTNEIIVELFGDLKKGAPVWQSDQFVTALRTDKTLLTPTLYAASPQKGTAGGRPDLIVFDDIVSETNSVTELGLKKGRRFIESSLALRGHRTRYLLVGTPYDERDANHWAIDAGWKKCTHLDVGVDVHVDDQGYVQLSGEARWPNLSIDFLRKYLKSEKKDGGGASFEWFMSQFKLQVVRGQRSHFKRTQFQPCQWNDAEHRQLTGFLLTDVAPSGSTQGDANVLMYVGLDEKNHIYILDCDVGFWQMYEFADRYLKMLEKWSTKVNHHHEMWEKSSHYYSYYQHINVQAKQRNIRVAFKAENRNQSVAGKDNRIAAMAVRFQAGEVHVMNTVPRFWNAGTQVRELWNPSDPEYGGLPGGDLVQQFVRFPTHAKKDIPDTFALLGAVDKETGHPLCFPVRSARRHASEEVRRQPISKSDAGLHGSSSRFYRSIAQRKG